MKNKELEEALDGIAAKIEDEILVNNIVTPLFNLIEQLDESQNKSQTVSEIIKFLKRVYVFNILSEIDPEGLTKICKVVNEISRKENILEKSYLQSTNSQTKRGNWRRES